MRTNIKEIVINLLVFKIMKNREIIGQMSTSRHSPNPHTGKGMENAEQK